MVPAAQYLRMSTEHQSYSLKNQQAAIAEYAVRNGLEVIKTYSDPAKSGLLLKGRMGLRELLRDVINGNTSYKVILVYDVSRWGRFQDDDEAACYEFLCRNAGVRVIYCAESFPNDGSVASSILKTLSRASAGEFSRELSTAVFEAKMRVVKRGFWVGGPAPYAYRRMIVSKDPARSQILKDGERKCLSTDRVILVPGPRRERMLVRAMFRMVLKKKGMGAGQIASTLNRQGFTNRGGPWLTPSVKKILTSPIYAGCNVWNRVSKKLGGPSIAITPEQWICEPGAFAAIVTRERFERTQYLLKKYREDLNWTDEEILSKLRALLQSDGKLSEDLFTTEHAMPSPATIRHHFGSIPRAYDLIGYKTAEYLKARASALRNTIFLRERMIEQISALFPGQVTISEATFRPRLHLKNGTTISALLAPPVPTKQAGIHWQVIPLRYEREHPVLLCLLSATGCGFHSFHLFPRIEFDRHRTHRTSECDPWLLSGKKLADLSELCESAS
jgi:DNA invertase Pin-like site-specific DNA recombinase